MSVSDESGYQSRIKNSNDDDDEDIVDEGDEDEYNDAIEYNAVEHDYNDERKNEDDSDKDDDDDDGEEDEEDEDDSSDSSPEIKRSRFSLNIDDESKSSKNKIKPIKDELKRKAPTTTFNTEFGIKYMSNYGYKKGKGLGKKLDGIVEPVEASDQKGRRGLGYKAIGLKNSASKYDPSECVVNIDEEIIWLKNNYADNLSKKSLESRVTMGPPLESIDENSLFCDPEVISEIFSCKDALDSITSADMINGRTRSNPFEIISKGIFLNRAAMKMANMDAVLDYMFTDPKDIEGNKIIGPNDLLYFADVCAGPGGFSEYVLYRKNWRAKGFGFTLRKENDFKLDEFTAGPPETFEPHYGEPVGADVGDGDVYNPKNLENFRDHVLKYTDGKGVHFMMADGGFKVEKKNDQELLCKKLYLCQCLTALLVVRTEGHFVVKLFDLFTSFSVGLVYLMYRCFREILIIKPNTSRPANSERYLVCKWKRDDCEDIANFLFEMNKKVPVYMSGAREDVLKIVPDEELQEDAEFYEYVTRSSRTIGKNQIANLKKLAAFSENPNLKEERQLELRKKCLDKWNIPDTVRTEPKKCDPRTKWTEISGLVSPKELESMSDSAKNKIDSLESFKQNMTSIYSWYGLIISGEEKKNNCAFYLGLGRSNVYKFVGGRWIKWTEGQGTQDVVGLCLPPNSLVYGELVTEYLNEGKSQRRTYGFHIIDGIRLGNENIGELRFSERWRTCKLFAKSLNKKNFSVSVKNHVPLKDIDLLFRGLVNKRIRYLKRETWCVPLKENTFWQAGGVIFIRDTRDPWNRFLSSKNGFFLHNKDTDSGEFESKVDMEPFANFKDSFVKQLIWWWDSEGDSNKGNQKKMTNRDLVNYVREKDISKRNGHPVAQV